eukprot:1153110-Pelagomonas_calceolata.AAC.3
MEGPVPKIPDGFKVGCIFNQQLGYFVLPLAKQRAAVVRLDGELLLASLHFVLPLVMQRAEARRSKRQPVYPFWVWQRKKSAGKESGLCE